VRATYAFALALALVAPAASAQVRKRFEPTDLDLVPEGILELDTQMSYTEAESTGRAVIPDFEIALGIAPRVQIEVDGAYAVEGAPGFRFSFDHPAPDNLWLSSKIGLADWRDGARDRAWALGMQLGPKVPLAPSARGVGYEALALVGRSVARTHIVVDAGAFVDPSSDATLRRTVAVEGGVDLDIDLDAAGRWSLLGEIGTAVFLSGEANQAHVTCGLQYSASPSLDLSLIGLVGLLSGGDRGGVLLGVTPRFALWK
jgi:hypothetical protein